MAEHLRISQPKLQSTHGNKGSIIMAAGTVNLDGSGATLVDCFVEHKINEIRGALCQPSFGSAPGDQLASAWPTWTGSTLIITPWEYTSGSDPTLVGSDSTILISYLVWGVV